MRGSGISLKKALKTEVSTCMDHALKSICCLPAVVVGVASGAVVGVAVWLVVQWLVWL